MRPSPAQRPGRSRTRLRLGRGCSSPRGRRGTVVGASGVTSASCAVATSPFRPAEEVTGVPRPSPSSASATTRSGHRASHSPPCRPRSGSSSPAARRPRSGSRLWRPGSSATGKEACAAANSCARRRIGALVGVHADDCDLPRLHPRHGGHGAQLLPTVGAPRGEEVEQDGSPAEGGERHGSATFERRQGEVWCCRARREHGWWGRLQRRGTASGTVGGSAEDDEGDEADQAERRR